MKKLFYPLVVLFTCAGSVAFCQGTNPALQNIVSKLKTFASNYIVEKAYLHFDKPYYVAGDEMYFKAYVTIGDAHTLSKESGILHVDLVNPGNVIIKHIIVQLDNGVAPGSFSLPDTLQGGAYRVRAYTRYMKNTPEYFFDKTIPVISVSGVTGANPNTTQAAKPDLQFFPEGGQMIAGLLTKVAFKAIGTNGLGINAKGTIVDNANLQVATFNSSHLGMGSFYIQPEAGKTYKAKITFANGTQSTIDLPAPAVKGITLQAKDTLGKISIDIVANKPYYQDNQNKDVNLVILSSGKLRTINTKLDSRVMGMDLQKDQLSSGIVQITLFSQDGEPLSERLVFLQNASLLNITTTTDKQSYKTRDRVAVNFNAKSNGLGAQGFFSAAVVDESRVPYDDNNETTILSYLLLSSDLKGYIEQPNYYFANNTPQASKDLDNLMLSQGYRQFTWKTVLNGENKPFTFASEKNLFLSGAEKTTSGAPVVGKEVILTGGPKLLTAKTDESGKFLFDNMPPYYAGTQFTLQATGSTRDKNSTTVTLDQQPEPPVANSDFLGNLSHLTAGASNNGSGSGITANAAQVVDGDDISGASSMTAGLNGKLTGVTFTSGMPYLKGNKYPMLLVVDGKIHTSDMKLDNIAPAGVKSVGVLTGSEAAAYGPSGSSGVLVINTRTGSGLDAQANNTHVYESQNVTRVTPEKGKMINYRSSSLGGAGHADQVVMGSEIENAPSLTSGLNGLLRGVDFNGGVPTLRGGSVVTGVGSGTEPMYIIVDGVPTPGSLDNINPRTVEAVEVLKGPNASIYGVQGGPGVLVITSRTQSDEVQTTSSAIGSLIFKPQGYYKVREFYSPKYDAASNAPGNAPDKRTTIYWNPSLATDKDGNASFDFYNSDGRGTYRVIIEGIDSNGNPGRQLIKYKVE